MKSKCAYRTVFGTTRCRLLGVAGSAVILALGLFPAQAQAAAEAEVEYILNTFAFLIWGALVMWMAAGFTMLEAGSVRTKNASVICLKNIGLYCIAGLTFYVIGYNLMYVGVEDGGWIGSFRFLYATTPDEVAVLAGAKDVSVLLESKYAAMSNWFFQMVFVGTTASIVSGALAERVKLWSFFVFIAILTAFIYPVVGAATWGGGWLAKLGFQDFAGSTIVHSTGGWAALAGLLIVGPRKGKYRRDGTVKPTPPSNVPAVTLGVFILWFGWFGFNGGSQLSMSGAVDALAVANILVNTNLAATAGVMMAIAVARRLLGRVDLLAGLNGGIAGLVAITAAPEITAHHWAIAIGAVGGLICVVAMRTLERLKIDDVVGAVPAHLWCGIWGTLAVCIAGGGTLWVQLVGIVSVGVFVFGTSYATWWAIDKVMGVRITGSVEDLGQDTAELGIESYPEFVLFSEPLDD